MSDDNDNPIGNFATARQGSGGVPPRSLPHPENTCFGCVAVGVAVVLALIIAGYVYWRYNPEFHIETAGPKIHTTPTAPAKR